MIFLKSQDCVFKWRFWDIWLPDVNLVRVERSPLPLSPAPPSSPHSSHISCVPPPPPHTTSVARLPGRNSGQKAQKGPQKKKFLAEFWLILPKTGRKGAAENFQNKFLIFSCWPNFLDVLAGNFFGTWQHCTQLGFAVPARPASSSSGWGGGTEETAQLWRATVCLG